MPIAPVRLATDNVQVRCVFDTSFGEEGSYSMTLEAIALLAAELEVIVRQASLLGPGVERERRRRAQRFREIRRRFSWPWDLTHRPTHTALREPDSVYSWAEQLRDASTAFQGGTTPVVDRWRYASPLEIILSVPPALLASRVSLGLLLDLLADVYGLPARARTRRAQDLKAQAVAETEQYLAERKRDAIKAELAWTKQQLQRGRSLRTVDLELMVEEIGPDPHL
jgi:hypothetical protein